MPARESVSDIRPKMFEASRLPKFLVTFQLLLFVHVFTTCCRCVDVDECSEGTVNPCPNQCECVHAALCVTVACRYLRVTLSSNGHFAFFRIHVLQFVLVSCITATKRSPCSAACAQIPDASSLQVRKSALSPRNVHMQVLQPPAPSPSTRDI